MTSRWHSTDPAGDGYEGAEPPRCDDCGEINDVEPCACYRAPRERIYRVVLTGHGRTLVTSERTTRPLLAAICAAARYPGLMPRSVGFGLDAFHGEVQG